MDPTTKKAIEFVIDRHELRRDHDTIGNLIDALYESGMNPAAQKLREAMSKNDLLSRSTLINNFLRDIEKNKTYVKIKSKEVSFPSSIQYRCNHWTGSSMCSNRASVLLITDTEPLISFGLCTDHQYGDLSKIPLAQARALPWEDEKEGDDPTK